jgi:GTP-binding protein Era
MISALHEDGLDALLHYCHRRAVPEPWPFPEDQISTMPFRLMTAEITREAAMDLLHKEIPYDLTVYTEDVEHFDNGDLRVSQIILVEKNSQKTIVLGKGGQKIKSIGAQARKEMTEVFDQKIHLSLLVKVKPNWKTDPEYYRLWNLQQ